MPSTAKPAVIYTALTLGYTLNPGVHEFCVIVKPYKNPAGDMVQLETGRREDRMGLSILTHCSKSNL